ncbi:MAG: hypothetical protein F6K25_00690 [Okeania sp. SIO2G4]|nr:hypothetical protein [Okeania sp. SIO2H7]NEP70676.1 hypothetical protein [Okeania sp. SIO2G5]NEP91921.1 hypothetical protein [Okeania sp. SIO2F5]NEQ89344.1 hypothetical protein [Okeania sp. SIO2G4]
MVEDLLKMKKLVVTVLATCLLLLTTALPAYADREEVAIHWEKCIVESQLTACYERLEIDQKEDTIEIETDGWLGGDQRKGLYWLGRIVDQCWESIEDDVSSKYEWKWKIKDDKLKLKLKNKND